MGQTVSEEETPWGMPIHSDGKPESFTTVPVLCRIAHRSSFRPFCNFPRISHRTLIKVESLSKNKESPPTVHPVRDRGLILTCGSNLSTPERREAFISSTVVFFHSSPTPPSRALYNWPDVFNGESTRQVR